MANLNEKALGLLKGKNFAFVATVKKDGSPHLTPVWIDTDESNLLINTAVGRAKERNTSRDSRISVSVADSANPYSYLTFDGKVTKRITGKKAEDHIDFLSFKYTGNKKYQGRSPGQKRIILVVKPTHIRGM